MGNKASYSMEGGESGAAAASSSSSSSSTSYSSILNSAQHCPSDILHLIHSYLTLHDRHHAAITCKRWLEAARWDQVNTAAFTFQRPRPDVDANGHVSVSSDWCGCSIPFNLAQSSLRHWITSLRVERQRYPRAHPCLHHLACALELPRLQSLTYFLDPASIQGIFDHDAYADADADADADRMGNARSDSAALVLQLPHTLTSLDITIIFHHQMVIQRRCHSLLMHALTHLRSLHSLRIRMSDGRTGRNIDEDWSLLPALTKLKHLHVETWLGVRDPGPSPNNPSKGSLLQCIKQLPALESLRLQSNNHRMSQSSSAASSEGWSVSNLSRLCAWTHQCGALHSLILIDAKLTKVHMEQLINLPSLTTLQPRSFTIGALPYLRQFPHLSDLSLCVPQFRHSRFDRFIYNIRHGADDDQQHLHHHQPARPPDEDDESSLLWMDAAAPILASCSNLTSMTLSIHVGFEDARFDRLFRSLPHVRRCTLNFPENAFRARYYTYAYAAPDDTLHALSHVAASLEELTIMSGSYIEDLPRVPPLPKLHTLKRGWIGWDRTRSRSRVPTLKSLMVDMHLSWARTPMLRTLLIQMMVGEGEGEETRSTTSSSSTSPTPTPTRTVTFQVNEALLQEIDELLFSSSTPTSQA